jgi:putative endonuclease
MAELLKGIGLREDGFTDGPGHQASLGSLLHDEDDFRLLLALAHHGGIISRPLLLKPWLVYMLRCSDGSLYTGITNDLPKRLKAHAAGKASRYTRSRLPVRLAHQEPQPTKSRALKREAAIKKLTRREKTKLIAAG